MYTNCTVQSYIVIVQAYLQAYPCHLTRPSHNTLTTPNGINARSTTANPPYLRTMPG